jgi:hypothetical protein
LGGNRAVTILMRQFGGRFGGTRVSKDVVTGHLDFKG